MNGMRRLTSLCFSALALGTFAADLQHPDWSQLDVCQQTLTRAEFSHLLDTVYCPNGELNSFLAVTDEKAELFADAEKKQPLWQFQFAAEEKARKVIRPSFKTLDDLRAFHNPSDAPLHGIRIGIDPGHIGGEYARMEERFFVFGSNRPVQEAVLNLTVANLLKKRLESAGATVLIVKDDFHPVTKQKPEDFRAEAAEVVDEIMFRTPIEQAKLASMSDLERVAYREDLVRKRMELHFYRYAEITARADHLNNLLRPDLTLCIHFNAHAWDNPPQLIKENALVVFIHGAYSADELRSEQQKFELMSKVLEGSHATELAAAEKVSRALAHATGLPPVNPEPTRVTANPYIVPRNLIANRLYRGPVLYLEPYYQNNADVYARLLAGDYDGEREIVSLGSDGHPVAESESKKYRSIYREYADAVAQSLIEFYSEYTVTPSPAP